MSLPCCSSARLVELGFDISPCPIGRTFMVPVFSSSPHRVLASIVHVRLHSEPMQSLSSCSLDGRLSITCTTLGNSLFLQILPTSTTTSDHTYLGATSIVWAKSNNQSDTIAIPTKNETLRRRRPLGHELFSLTTGMLLPSLVVHRYYELDSFCVSLQLATRIGLGYHILIQPSLSCIVLHQPDPCSKSLVNLKTSFIRIRWYGQYLW